MPRLPARCVPANRCRPSGPLAEELRVNRNTIAKAYTELESQGVIETIPGKGCFLKENNSPFTKTVRQKLLLTEIDEAVVTAHHLQVDRDNFSRARERAPGPLRTQGGGEYQRNTKNHSTSNTNAKDRTDDEPSSD